MSSLELLLSPPWIYVLSLIVLLIIIVFIARRRLRLKEIQIGLTGPVLKFGPAHRANASDTNAHLSSRAGASTDPTIASLRRQLATWRRKLSEMEEQRAHLGKEISSDLAQRIAQAREEIARLQVELEEREAEADKAASQPQFRQIMEAEDEGIIRRSRQKRPSGDISGEQHMTAHHGGTIEDAIQE